MMERRTFLLSALTRGAEAASGDGSSNREMQRAMELAALRYEEDHR